ncbi:bifunctional diguanylate cyclase/phosphodiesterase [[Clostridium] innocuum]|nr:bifunctional diguanylate cyclase/phosphodiesterase [[Clostridium] innocuum]
MKDEIRKLQQEINDLKQELKQYKEYDSLTGLYNKHGFYAHADYLLTAFPSLSYQLFTIDFEHFKLINDQYGTRRGDELLTSFAELLFKSFQQEETACGRIHSDIFAILVLQGHEKEICEDISTIFRQCAQGLDVSYVIGVYDIKDRHIPIALMCDRAMMAANSIKGKYEKRWCRYDDSMRNVLMEEQELLTNVDNALEHGEFQLYIQPKCNMKTRKIVGGEVLVRWIHPKKGLIPPKDFIPIFEKNGFIKKLDAYVWEQTAIWLHKWSKTHPVLPVSVNVSRMDIMEMNVYTYFQDLIRKYKLDPSWLEIEVTESAYAGSEEIIHTIDQLMNHGFTVLMDDFGSGYSSLNILKDININILKLDMRFLDSQNSKSRNILDSILQMARWLGMKVIAEGLENKDQADFLLNIGCMHAQGFYYYKPMPLQEFEQLLLQSELVDTSDYLQSPDYRDQPIHLKDFFREDMLSDMMLNHILGAVAVFRIMEHTIQLYRANDAYYQLTADCIRLEDGLLDFLDNGRTEFQNLIVHAHEFHEHGSEKILHLKTQTGDRWLKYRCYFLATRGNTQIVYASISDVSDYMQTMEDLRLSRESFRIAMEASQITIFELDIENRVASYSQNAMRAFDLDDCIMINAPEGFIEQGSVCEGYEDIFRSIYNDIYNGSPRASCVIRAHMAEGDVFNRITLTAIQNEKGKSVRAVGCVENITEEILRLHPHDPDTYLKALMKKSTK